MNPVYRIHFGVGGTCFPFHLGVIDYIRNKRINVSKKQATYIYSGSSVGSLMATIMALDIDTTAFLNECEKEQRRILRYQKTLFGEWSDSLCRVLDKFIPDIQIPVTNLYINAFNVKKLKNEVFSRFEHKSDIIEAIVRSCHIPFLLDYKLFHNIYLDGVISNILFGIDWNLKETELFVIRIPSYYIVTQTVFPVSYNTQIMLYKKGRIYADNMFKYF